MVKARIHKSCSLSLLTVAFKDYFRGVNVIWLCAYSIFAYVYFLGSICFSEWNADIVQLMALFLLVWRFSSEGLGHKTTEKHTPKHVTYT